MGVMGLIIWDLDGTLVDSRADIVAAAHAARQAIDASPLTDDTIASFVGDGVGKLIDRLVADLPEDAQRRAACLRVFEHAYATGCTRRTACYPGMLSAVHLLAERGWRHAVATNKADAYVEPILAHCGLSSLIAAWRGGDGPRKPDPAQVVSLHQQLGATAAWMIGDHHTDLLAAAAAGIPAIFCTWGLGHDGGVPARARVNAPADLPELIGWP